MVLNTPLVRKMRADRLFLNDASLRILDGLLPEPLGRHTIGKAQFNVFLGKKFSTDRWLDPVLRRIVIEARKSYEQFYGEISLLDEYDRKSVVYLTQVIFPVQILNEIISVSQWYSLRFIPAAGEPYLNTDLDFYTYRRGKKRIPVFDLMKDRLRELQNSPYGEAASHIVSHSRFCTTEPYILNTKYQGNSYTEKIIRREKLKQSTAGISFALMNKYFFQYIDQMNMPFTILTCQMSRITSDKILTYTTEKGKRKLSFISARNALGYKNKYCIVVDRDKRGVYAYSYPGYFLNINDLVHVLRELVKRKMLSQDYLSTFLDKGLSLETFLKNPHMKYFHTLGKMFTKNGKFEGSSITGKGLRTILNKKVRDGSVLYIMNIKKWRDNVNEFIYFAQTNSKNL